MVEYSHKLLEETKYLPLPRQAGGPLVLWLLLALRTLVTLICVQSGLRGAVATQQNVQLPNGSLIKKIDEVTADGSKKLAAGQISEALKSYTWALHAAQRAGDLEHQSKAWLGICFLNLNQHSYSEAFRACTVSYRLGLQAGSTMWAGVAASDLAVIYRALGEYALSEERIEEALRLLGDCPRKEYIAKALLYRADLSLEQGRFREGIAFSDRAISVATKANLTDLVALLWDVRGFALLKANQLTEAETALKQAQAVQVNGGKSSWFFVILGHRSELEFKKGNYAEALRLNDQAFAPNHTFNTVPSYYFPHVRAQILLAVGRKQEALIQFRRATELATSWRQAAVPGDSTSTQTVVYLNEVYHDFAQLAAEMAWQGHDRELSRQALEALAQNRAASLREQLTILQVRDAALNDQYFRLLSDLKAAQARVTLGRNYPEDASRLHLIRLELSELENQSLTLSTKKEKYRFQNSLKSIQARLDQSDVLLSFCLGKTRSFLWAVTVDDVELYELPKQAEIEQHAKSFADALHNGRNDSSSPGLSQILFGQLEKKISRKRNWIITEDGTSAGLIPYAALSDVSAPGRPQPLVANHSLRLLPSELLLLIPDTAKPEHRFVGIGDPIYNLADSRRTNSVGFIHADYTEPTASLGRLVGSDREIKAAAKLSRMPETRILAGPDATGAALRSALNPPPELLHFAVHVVSPEGKPQEAALALSLTNDKMPELLTKEAIAAYRVPGSLVVLSGCSSGQGKALPSAGLIGLGRAWLLAGASAVVVSSWPTPDDSGEFFSAFYDRLQKIVTGSLAQRAATALEEAQLDMQHSSGYRASPSYWAAYSILSKE